MNSKRTVWQMCILVVISICIYALQVVTFHNSHDTFFYLLQDMAFLPITIVITTLIVGTMLEKQSRKERIEASRILSSSFFSILGNPLIEYLCSMMDDDFRLKWDRNELDRILELLDSNKNTVLTIASNPNMLEHEKFTDLLWATLHLWEELYNRKGQEVPLPDQLHILTDAQRVFDLYLENWDDYSEYIGREYPYFFMSETFLRWKEQAGQLKK